MWVLRTSEHSRTLRALLCDDGGQVVVEYAVVLCSFTLALLTALTFMGNQLFTSYSSMTTGPNGISRVYAENLPAVPLPDSQ